MPKLDMSKKRLEALTSQDELDEALTALIARAQSGDVSATKLLHTIMAQPDETSAAEFVDTLRAIVNM